MASVSTAVAPARIGPNAVIRLVEALTAAGVDPHPIFAAADRTHHLTDPPTMMVPEADVTVLYAALRARLGFEKAARIADDAGRRTALYLLAHRIPRPAQVVLRTCPAGLAQRLLLTLIAKHAWTFAGSAQLTIQHGRPARVIFDGSPFARGATGGQRVCDFYVGTFRTLGRALITPEMDVVETACAAAGAPRCVLELRR